MASAVWNESTVDNVSAIDAISPDVGRDGRSSRFRGCVFLLPARLFFDDFDEPSDAGAAVEIASADTADS